MIHYLLHIYYHYDAGCMLCFGQSAFFRFNHPEEALYMKSLLPGGLSSPRTQPDGKIIIFFRFPS